LKFPLSWLSALLWSLAWGVGHIAANPFSSSSFERAPLRAFRPPVVSATLGVGQARCASVKVVPECRPLSVE